MNFVVVVIKFSVRMSFIRKPYESVDAPTASQNQQTDKVATGIPAKAPSGDAHIQPDESIEIQTERRPDETELLVDGGSNVGVAEDSQQRNDLTLNKQNEGIELVPPAITQQTTPTPAGQLIDAPPKKKKGGSNRWKACFKKGKGEEETEKPEEVQYDQTLSGEQAYGKLHGFENSDQDPCKGLSFLDQVSKLDSLKDLYTPFDQHRYVQVLAHPNISNLVLTVQIVHRNVESENKMPKELKLSDLSDQDQKAKSEQQDQSEDYGQEEGGAKESEQNEDVADPVSNSNLVKSSGDHRQALGSQVEIAQIQPELDDKADSDKEDSAFAEKAKEISSLMPCEHCQSELVYHKKTDKKTMKKLKTKLQNASNQERKLELTKELKDETELKNCSVCEALRLEWYQCENDACPKWKKQAAEADKAQSGSKNVGDSDNCICPECYSSHFVREMHKKKNSRHYFAKTLAEAPEDEDEKEKKNSTYAVIGVWESKDKVLTYKSQFKVVNPFFFLNKGIEEKETSVDLVTQKIVLLHVSQKQGVEKQELFIFTRSETENSPTSSINLHRIEDEILFDAKQWTQETSGTIKELSLKESLLNITNETVDGSENYNKKVFGSLERKEGQEKSYLSQSCQCLPKFANKYVFFQNWHLESQQNEDLDEQESQNEWLTSDLFAKQLTNLETKWKRIEQSALFISGDQECFYNLGFDGYVTQMKWIQLDEIEGSLNYWDHRQKWWRPTDRDDTEYFIREARDLDCFIHCKNKRLSIVSKQNKKVLTWALGSGDDNNKD